MPGPKDPSDQAAGAYGRGSDSPRRPDPPGGPADRPARGSLADLEQRLERLPLGHPSSPYHDDGSSKTPVVRLKDLELPLPGESGTGETEVRQAQVGETRVGEAHTGAPADDAHTGDAHTGDAHTGDAHTGDAHTGDAQAGEAQAGEAQAGEAYADETYADDADRSQPERSETDPPEAAENAPDALEETDSRPVSDPPRIWADGSWEWKGQHLTSGQGKIAEEMLSRCRAAEGRTVFGTYADTGLTPAMRQVEAQLEHGHLVPDTEKFALKSADRFKEKLAKLIARNPDKPPDELAKEIHDNVRYTYLFEESHYLEGIWQAHDALEDQGYELEVRRNSWDNHEYKGVNTRWRDQ